MVELATAVDNSGVSILHSMGEFVIQHGRRPRILVVTVGQNILIETARDEGVQGEGAKIMATAFADLGFDVDLSPNLGNSFVDSKEIVRQAIENDVHVIGLNIQIAASADDQNVLSCVLELITELKAQEAGDILLVTAGDISNDGHKALEKAGVTESLRPDTQMLVAVKQLLAAIVGDNC